MGRPVRPFLRLVLSMALSYGPQMAMGGRFYFGYYGSGMDEKPAHGQMWAIVGIPCRTTPTSARPDHGRFTR